MPKKLILLIILVALMTVLATSLVLAQTGGVFDLTWSTIDGGGGSSSGGNFDLSGTIGQADAGSLSGGNFILNGGFWPGGVTTETTDYLVYLPVIIK